MNTSINKHCFASDNHSGVAKEAWAAMETANVGFADAYGDDEWTAKAADKIREVFETDCEVFFAFNGTASNALALAAICQSYHSVLAHSLSHIETSECGAPEFFSGGSKLLTTDGALAKLQPSTLEVLATQRTDMHFPKPKAISLTQCTEFGTIYTPQELAEISALAKKLDMHLHMDGARFANAVAALKVRPKEISWQAGVDVLCLGGSKNGMAIGDAIVFFNRDLAQDFEYRCKQAGQLASKMRYITAPWEAMLKDDIWLGYAAKANQSAQLLSKKLIAMDGIELAAPTQANGVFVKMPSDLAKKMREKGWLFHDYMGESCQRFMCSWSTSKAEIEAFCSELCGLN